MAEGIALHLGLDRLDATHYCGFGSRGPIGWEGTLAAAERDARDLEGIARARGFATSMLLSVAATVDAVTAAIRRAAASLEQGDIFVLTFAGYGGQVPDQNSVQRWREKTWALYDRQLPEDELISSLSGFQHNVRVLVVDDSSASETVQRGLPEPPSADGAVRTRAIPPEVATETYRNHQAVYDEVQRSCPSSDEAVVPASMINITGCMPNQLAVETGRNGLFTEALLRVWDDGRFGGDYRRFVDHIGARMPPTQSPELTVRSSASRFARESPFTI